MNPTKFLDDYQVESFEFLNSRTFACLFDSPGVGKTGPAILAGYEAWKTTKLPALITCPAYLIANWRQEIKAFIPTAVVVTADGKGAVERQEALQNRAATFVITSYNNWSATTGSAYTYPDLVDKPWSAYIFDEGHRLRGPRSKATKHVYRTRLANSPNRTTPLWVLTGTPFVRDGSDFFTYFHLYNKKQYGSYWKFVQERCVTTETPWGPNIGNIRKSYTKEFQAELAQFSLRRTTKDIPQLESLEFVEHEYFVTMPPSVLKAIKKAKEDYVLEHDDMASAKFLESAGALYVLQRQIATVPPTKVNPKVDWLKDFLTDRKGQVVLYVWYKQSAQAVYDLIAKSDRKAYLATGDLTAGRRLDSVDAWRKDSTGVLVATIPALKEGISLTEASEVVFLEHSELPSDQEQTIKRLCRRGQTKVVQVHHVHAKGTVDMAIRNTLKNRNQGIAESLARWIKDDLPEEDGWFN